MQLETALRRAGFADTQISVEEKDFVYADEEQYWSSLWSAGFRRQLEKITPDLLEQAKNEVFQKIQKFQDQQAFDLYLLKNILQLILEEQLLLTLHYNLHL